MVVYDFEDIDASLTLVPLAGRRALDRAHRKLTLAAWQQLSIDARRAIVDAGSREVVDADAVAQLIDAATWSDHDAWPEPSRDGIDHHVITACMSQPIAMERWSAVRAIDRWALTSLARRDKREALTALRRELGL